MVLKRLLGSLKNNGHCKIAEVIGSCLLFFCGLIFFCFPLTSVTFGVDTNCWQMKQKDVNHTGRVAYTVPSDRLNDTFFDDILWQTPTTGAFNGSGFAYFDGVGPNGADVAVCGNTWPNRVTCVDRHTGELFWQDSPGGGDTIGKITPAFSNDGATIYVTTDSLADRSLAFSTLTGPAGGYWGNSGEADPTRMSMLSPTVASDGRIFMHKWNNACFAGIDNGSAITEVWVASEGVGVCLSDTTLYQDGEDLLVIQTGRAGRVMAFDGATGSEVWRVQTYQGTDCSATVDPENGNIYYAAGLNRELYVIGLDKDGNDLWGSTKLLLNDSENEPNRLERARSTGCLSHDGRTYYFLSTGEVDNGKLYAVNTVDGSVKWLYEIHCKRDVDDFSSSPVVTQNGVLVVGNVLGGQYHAIKDESDHATLLDSITMEPEWNTTDKRQAKGLAVISADGKLYLPVRSNWTVGNGDGVIPDGTVRYCLAAFDLSGCDGPVPMDFNGDCKVNLIDLAEFASYWMVCELQPPERCFE